MANGNAQRSKRQHPYRDGSYRIARRELTANGATCWKCGRDANTIDHIPALAEHDHVRNSGCCELYPACGDCNFSSGGRLGARRRAARAQVKVKVDLSPNPSRQW